MGEEKATKAAPEPEAAGPVSSEGSEGFASGPAAVLALQRSAGNAAVNRALSVQRWGVPVVGTVLGGLIAMLRSGLTDRRPFLEEAYAHRHRPIFRAEWDAWGHAVCGAGAAAVGTEFEAWALGTLREALQDATVGQDSSAQDRHNQGVGRSLVSGFGGGGEILSRCTEAYLGGRLRIGPDRASAFMPWVPAGDDFTATYPHEGALWCPRRGEVFSNPRYWVEAVEPGNNGTAMGSGRSPTTPMPEGYEPP